MARRSQSSFQKHQKELVRIERQKDKAARRLERKRQARADGPQAAAGEGTAPAAERN